MSCSEGAEERFERPREPSRRLFFAIWPDHDQQTAFAHAARKAVKASGGAAVPVVNIHLTLLFVGSTPERRTAELVAIARRVAGSSVPETLPLELEFESLEHWRKPQVLCAVPTSPPGPLAFTIRLAQSLRTQATAAGFTPSSVSEPAGFGKAQEFRPHVTLVRKAVRAPGSASMTAVIWRFAEFVLVDSRTGGQASEYRIVESFPLSADNRPT